MSTNRFIDFDTAEQPLTCAFHPSQDLLATGLVDGSLQLLACSGEAVTSKVLVREHEDSCRAITFHSGGTQIASGSADKSIAFRDIQQAKMIARLQDAHDAAVNRLHSLDSNLLASGDENGCLKTWDSRQRSSIHQFASHRDYIADMAFWEHNQCLLAVSGDGCLSVNEIRTGKVRAISDGDADDELTSVAVLKNGKKVICGAQTGVMNIFSWGKFENYSDRFAGHPSSVDAILKLDEDTVITGSSDGVLRVVTIQPHALIGILGQHDEFGCETIAISHNRHLLASTSYGSTIRFRDTSFLDESDDQEQSTSHLLTEKHKQVSSDEEQSVNRKRKKNSKKNSTRNMKANDQSSFFKDLV